MNGAYYCEFIVYKLKRKLAVQLGSVELGSGLCQLALANTLLLKMAYFMYSWSGVETVVAVAALATTLFSPNINIHNLL